MHKLLFLLSILLLGCSANPVEDSVGFSEEYEKLAQGLSDPNIEGEIGAYCFWVAALEILKPHELFDFHMRCGTILFKSGDYLSASTEFMFATDYKDTSEENRYTAYLNYAYSQYKQGHYIGSMFLVDELEKNGIGYGAEAVALSLGSTLKSVPKCSIINNLLDKLLQFEDWQSHIESEGYLKISKKCKKFNKLVK